ncbi:bacteriophage replication gene A protein [Paraburkholderia unamae]|nr:bacteriophage replication gene A protein [Paraburkholderia unamae]
MQVSPQQIVTDFTGSQPVDASNRGRISIFGRRHGRVTSRDQSFTLAALAAGGRAEKAGRAANLITRMAELERLAQSGGDTAMLVSITCPSRMHRLKTVDGQDQANPEWNGTMPHIASGYLSRVWFRARASIARNGVDIYGAYVQKLHSDGTPYLVCLVYYTPIDGPVVRSAIRHFALDIEDLNQSAPRTRVNFIDVLEQSARIFGDVAARRASPVVFG